MEFSQPVSSIQTVTNTDLEVPRVEEDLIISASISPPSPPSFFFLSILSHGAADDE